MDRLRGRRRAHLIQRFRAELLFFGRALRVLGQPVGGLVLSLVLGAAGLHAWGATASGPAPGWGAAFFQAYALLLGEEPDTMPLHPVGQVVCYLQPLLGVVFLAEGIIKLGITVFRKEQNSEAWVRTMAKASRGHVLVVGVGNVGFRTIEELVRLGELVIAVERDERGSFVERARALGAHVLIGDARQDTVLRSLNVERASSVIVATDDDLANLEIAMDVRNLRADVPIVLRLFDQELARKVRPVLGVDVTISSSQLAAPFFASAALDRSVVGAHRVGSALAVVVEIPVELGSTLCGASVAALLRDERLLVLARRPAGGDWEVQPPHDTVLDAGDHVQIVLESGFLPRVHALARPRGAGS